MPVELRDVLKQDTFEKARQYHIENRKFSFYSSLYHQVELTVCLGDLDWTKVPITIEPNTNYEWTKYLLRLNQVLMEHKYLV